MNNRETKDFLSDIQDIDNKQGIVIISVAGIGNKDSGNDIIMPNSFKKTITERFNKIYHLIDHAWSTSTMVGVPLKIYESNDRLIAESKLNLKQKTSRDLFAKYLFLADLKRSFEHSIGFDIPKNKYEMQGDVRVINEVRLYEYSTVLLGMNSNTETLTIKNLEQQLNNHNILEQQLKYPYSTETLQRIEKMLELYLKNENLTLQQSTDLPQDSNVADNTTKNLTLNITNLNSEKQLKDTNVIDNVRELDKPIITPQPKDSLILQLLKHL